MTMHNWKFYQKSRNSVIYVDFQKQKTKIVGSKFIYIYDGIFPYIDPEWTKRYKK